MLMGLWKLTKVCERKKKGVKAIIGKENSVTEGVQETNRNQNGHLSEGIGEEDPNNHEGERGYEEGGVSGIIWELWGGCYHRADWQRTFSEYSSFSNFYSLLSLNSYQILIVNFSSYQ